MINLSHYKIFIIIIVIILLSKIFLSPKIKNDNIPPSVVSSDEKSSISITTYENLSNKTKPYSNNKLFKSFKIDIDINGNKIRDFNKNFPCKRINLESLKPHHLHIVFFVSPKDIDNGNYIHHRNSFIKYAALHGYNFHVVDPSPIINLFRNHFTNVGMGNMIKHWKALYELYMLKNIHHHYGCDAQWVLFLDSDTFIIDYSRTLESIISFSNINSKNIIKNNRWIFNTNKNKQSLSVPGQCEIIAQDSVTTLNTGVIFFRISTDSEEILTNWINIQTNKLQVDNIRWQDDQGWIQYLYLKYCEKELEMPLPIDCAGNNNDLSALFRGTIKFSNFNIARLDETPKRSMCYAKMLEYLGMHPGSRSLGKYCILSGFSLLDRINIHDWTGVPMFHDNKYYHILHLPPFDKPGKCLFRGAFLYHGKNFNFISEIIKRNNELTEDDLLKQQYNSIKYNPLDKMYLYRPNVMRGNKNNSKASNLDEYNICNDEIINIYNHSTHS